MAPVKHGPYGPNSVEVRRFLKRLPRISLGRWELVVATYKMMADLPDPEAKQEWWETLEMNRKSRPVEGVERADDEELLRAMDAAGIAVQAGRSYARLKERGEEDAIEEIIKWAQLGVLVVVCRYVSPQMFESLFYPYRFAGGEAILEPGNHVWPKKP